MMLFDRSRTLFVLLLASQSADLCAGNLDAGQLLNEQQRLQPRSEPTLQDAEPEAPELQFEQTKTPDKINIVAIHFQGAEQLPATVPLQEWVAGAIGKQLSFEQLKQLADHVTQALRNAGYLLARAYLPQQDVTDGNIQINIVQGQLDDKDGIKINGQDLRINQLQLQDILAQNVQAGRALLKKDLERSLLLINDLPGLSAQGSVGAGSQPGTSKVTVSASEGPFLKGGIWADNFGNHYTGTWRGNGLLNVNDPLHIGDQLRVIMTGSEGILLGSARYSLPLTANGLNMEMHYSNLQYQIGREFTDAQLTGEANSVGSSWSYPFIRSRAFSLWGSVGYEHRGLRDNGQNQNTSDRAIDEAVLTLNSNTVDYWLGGGITNSRIGMISGHLDRGDNAGDLTADQQSAHTQGAFTKFAYSLARLQKLNSQWAFYGAIYGQRAGGNLDSSEKFMLGGPNGVRAYPVGEASGDHGWVLNAELRWDVLYAASSLGQVQLIGFIDTGHITLHDQAWAGAITNLLQRNNYQLSGGGISLNLTKNGRYQISGTWALPIGGNPGRDTGNNNADGQQNGNRFWLQAMVWF